MKAKVNILFHLIKSKATAAGLAPTNARITVDGQPIVLNTGRSVEFFDGRTNRRK